MPLVDMTAINGIATYAVFTRARGTFSSSNSNETFDPLLAVAQRLHSHACNRQRLDGPLFRQGAKTVRVTLDGVEYILGTGHNWKGPISDFTLDIVKQSPDQVVSLCFPGKANRIDDLTLRFQHKNFVPPDRLLVYFYTLKPEE